MSQPWDLVIKFAIMALMFAMTACGQHAPRHPADAAPATPSPASLTDPAAAAAQKDWWMDKASRSLAGVETSGLPNSASLTSMSSDDFVATLLKQPGFADTTLKFGLYYLGLRTDSVRDSTGALTDSALQMPQAVAAARSLAGDGSFLDLLKLQQPLYVLPLTDAFLVDESNPTMLPPQPATQADVRAALQKQMQTELAALTQLAGASPYNQATFCNRVLYGDGKEYGLAVLVQFYGLPQNLIDSLQGSDQWFGTIIDDCFLNLQTIPDVVARVAFMAQKLPALLSMADGWTPDKYNASTLADLKTVDPSALGVNPASSLPIELYAELQNSSTNFDRRRSAYMLNRYFCDDLTPIDVALPADHPSDQHASDPACQACHYKLDPMAGFFRTIGANGQDFAGGKNITFDDGATAAIATYTQAWAAPAGSGRTWNVGYVRSSTDPKQNTYGQSMQDLFTIISTAPESRQCLVRRMFEFYVGENQAIDPGYLDDLTAKFNADAQKDPTAAYKNTVARLVLGNTFQQQDPVSNECYDLAPGAVPDQGPPCKISFILQRSCSTCHAGQAPAGGLDLTKWIDVGGGEQGFPDVQNGKQVAYATMLSDIYNRLTSTDQTQRMPLGQDMPNADRESLVLWLNDAMNNEGGQ